MANQDPTTSHTSTNQFTKGMNTDLDAMLLGPDSWSHARNAVNNSHDGKIGDLGNEPANLYCNQAPYTIIGALYVVNNSWVIFSTNNVSSEIGMFDESTLSYRKIVNDSCLAFSTSNLITGAVKKNYDCTYSAYWDDALNPSRMLNLDRPEYKIIGQTQDACQTNIYGTELDCQKLRLARLITTPSVSIKKGTAGGSLLNGSYQVAIAYTVNQIRVTDYFTPSNVQSIFSHQNVSGSIDITIDGLNTDYDEYEVAVISFIGQKMNVQKLGNYSTYQKHIFLDYLNPALPVIQAELIPLQTPSYEKSDAMYEVNDYLIRVGIHGKADFNYQPIANNIRAKWVALQVPADYYQKGGNIMSYMRDEQYAFFIRWVYNTGHKSASYHIPGRAAHPDDLQMVGGPDVFEASTTGLKPKWSVKNTAGKDGITPYATADGQVVAEGDMGYWESTELYPSNKNLIWGDLCGLPIRHHKFPDNAKISNSDKAGTAINILGIKFENIQHPLDFDGNPIDSIVGYEILRGNRDGNKSVIAKGIINNVGEYDIPNGITTKKGLYPNYPYNDLRIDPFLSKTEVKGGCEGKNYTPMGTFKKDIFTFHSPDTQFRNPFLSATEIKIESEDYGDVIGNYESVFKHPKHKMLRDFALFSAGLVGVGTGLVAVLGKKTTTLEGTRTFNAGVSGLMAGVVDGPIMSGGSPWVGPLRDKVSSEAASDTLLFPTSTLDPLGGGFGAMKSTTTEPGIFGKGIIGDIVQGALLMTYFVGKGADEALRIIRGLIPAVQFGYQYNSHGFYNNHKEVAVDNGRRELLEANYLEPYLQEFTGDYRVNNLYRSRAVILKLGSELINPSIEDNTRKTIGELGYFDNPTQQFKTTTSAYYVALKNQLAAQYGQLDSIIQIPVTQTVQKTEPSLTIRYKSPVMFGGDIYINRYTEKNSMFYFNDWMFDQPDNYPYDYRLRTNVPYPRYWINTQEFDLSSLMNAFADTASGIAIGATAGGFLGELLGNEEVGGIVGAVVGGAGGLALGVNSLTQGGDTLPNDYAHLDRSSNECTGKVSFGMNKAYFYLFNSGVRDFFVESEINIAQRDHDDTTASRHYDYRSYTDVSALFRSDIIKAGNNFKYDFSLSASRLLYNYNSWGAILPRDYNPAVAAQCYSYYPNRVIYSLPQTEENKKDNWIAYLANNYKDFSSKIRCMKPVHKSGAIIFFDNDSPVMFQGVDQLQTTGGIKVTIGDGGLFQQPQQSITNTDAFYQYGSCQDRYSVIGTPYGIMWASMNQGKIFQYSGAGMQDITKAGNKWRFAEYLPSKLLQWFPDYKNTDNTVSGIGIQAGYDSTNEMIYFAKRDYVPLSSNIKYDSIKNIFYILIGSTKVPIQLTDSKYFEDASWTVSYDPKNSAWISYHDWHPEYIISGKNHIMTTDFNTIWKHNSRCDLFCNFYGIDYPFEVEIPTSTGQEVTTIRSYEYLLEAYRYKNNCRDGVHILDQNFDRAIVYNSEQCSGLLKMHVKPKNDPWGQNKFPNIDSTGVNILFAKEENKYRFNALFDLIKDRGEYTGAELPMFITMSNGYVKNLNPKAIDYSKDAMQRKKFRHYTNKLFLRREVSGDTKLLLKLVNTKQLRSPR